MNSSNAKIAIVCATWVIILGLLIVGPGLRDWLGSDCQGAEVTVGQIDGGKYD